MAILLALTAAGAPAPAQEAAADGPEADAKLPKLWGDFLHYITIGKPNLAQSWGQAILDSPAEPRELYLLAVNTEGAQRVLARGAGIDELKPIIKQMRQMIEKGYESERADPEQIGRSIDMLGKSLRSFRLGKERLVRSGEYALPQIIARLMDPKLEKTDPVLRERLIAILPDIGKQAVRAYSVALQTEDPTLQQVLATALGEIGYYHAAPRLKELAQREGVLPEVKRAAEIALRKVAGAEALDKSASELFYSLATRYYYRAESISPDARYDTAKVWYWKPDAGLSFVKAPREIFNDVYAMRMSRLALEHNAKYYPAIPLWLAAYAKKRADLPQGADDPTQQADLLPPDYYALASSPRYLQRMLARGLRDRDIPVIMAAVNALAKSAGADSLVKPVSGGAQPLVEALSYPDRQVRFRAAEVLALALPRERFVGHEQVPGVLNEALRQTGRKTALVVIADPNMRNTVKAKVRDAGFDVIDTGDASAGLAEGRKGPGVDVAILAGDPAPAPIIRTMRRDPFYVGVPVIAATGGATLRQVAERDERVVVLGVDADPNAIAGVIEKATAMGTGVPLTPEQASAWASRAAGAIRRLALTGNPVYDLSRTLPALQRALGHDSADVQIAVANGLAVLPLSEAQQTLIDHANSGETDEAVRIATYKAATESVRLFGNQATDKQARAIVDVVTGSGSVELRTAAAQLLGALNLPSEMTPDLILGAEPETAQANP